MLSMLPLNAGLTSAWSMRRHDWRCQNVGCSEVPITAYGSFQPRTAVTLRRRSPQYLKSVDGDGYALSVLKSPSTMVGVEASRSNCWSIQIHSSRRRWTLLPSHAGIRTPTRVNPESSWATSSQDPGAKSGGIRSFLVIGLRDAASTPQNAPDQASPSSRRSDKWLVLLVRKTDSSHLGASEMTAARADLPGARDPVLLGTPFTEEGHIGAETHYRLCLPTHDPFTDIPAGVPGNNSHPT